MTSHWLRSATRPPHSTSVDKASTQKRPSPITASITAFLRQHVTPIASQLDADPATLFSTFRAAAQLDLLTPKLPQSWGSAGLSAPGYRQIQAEIAAHSGALAFLLTQHQSAASFLLAGENDELKSTYLAAMATGEACIGVGFSHLRRPQPTAIAQKVRGGYCLSGSVPWVTGAGLFDQFVGAASLPDGSAVFGLMPLANSLQNNGMLTVSPSMPMASMAATNTVGVQLENWFLEDAQVIGIKAPGWLKSRDHANPLSPLGLILGCTTAACRILSASLQRRQIEHPIAHQLMQEKAQMATALEQYVVLPESAYAEKIAFRGQAIALMNQCAQAAVIASGGAANGLTHPAKRILGEALVFSVSGQSNDGATASLDALRPTTHQPVYSPKQSTYVN